MEDTRALECARAFVGARWCDVVPRAAACPQLPRRVLLHAGPPYRGQPPKPVLHAAVQALLFDGLADSEAQAQGLIELGEVKLEPAQNHGVVTPLAQVVAASMPLFAVRHHAVVRYGAVLEGAAPALRFGSRAAACRERLDTLRSLLTDSVGPALRRAPVALDEVIRAALQAGDDCHARTAAANASVLGRLVGVDPQCAEHLRTLPAFVLPILMAAAAAALEHHGVVVPVLGGNGVDFGIRRRGARCWTTAPAAAPQGDRLPGQQRTVALPAIGDSVVIDYCGLGGQVDTPALRAALVDPQTGIVDPRRIDEARAAPRFNLAVLDAAGDAGLIGRGVYAPPADLFRAAAAAAADGVKGRRDQQSAASGSE